MKSKNGILMIMALVMIPALNSCKKGEDDPFLSLKSRKARVAGEWTIDSWIQESSYTSSFTYSGDNSTSSGTDKLEISGTNVTLTGTSSYSSSGTTSSSSTSGTGSVSASMTFEKDGNFTKKIEYKNVNITEVSGGSSSSYMINTTIETKGNWNFLGGVEEDFKNKERLILNITEEKVTSSYTASGDNGNSTSTDTYENGEYTEVWLLTMLKNKEIEMEGTIKNTSTHNNTDNSGGTTYVSSGNSTDTGKMTAKLSQK